MKDVSEILQQSYFQALNNISVGSIEVPFVDIALPNQPKPYIAVIAIDSVRFDDKDKFGQNVDVTLEVVTGQKSNASSSRLAQQITNAVTQVIALGEGFADLSPDFNMITSTCEAITTIKEITDNEVVIRRILVFNHLIEEL